MSVAALPTSALEVWVRRGDHEDRYGFVKRDPSGVLYFARAIFPNNVIRYLDGIAVDDAILDYVEKIGVKEIRYVIRGENGVYRTTPQEVCAHAVKRTMGRPPWPTHILPRKCWTVTTGGMGHWDEGMSRVTLEEVNARS
jgi:hypothetical protein